MTTHTHPEILEEIQAIDTHIAATEDRLLSEMYKIKDELKSDIAGLETSVAGYRPGWVLSNRTLKP